jgi:hypothetical protein
MHAAQFQLLILSMAGWVNRSQQTVIESLLEESWVLREQLGARRLLFTDAQRRRLRAKAKRVGRKGLFGIATVVTPDTLLRWDRRLIAKKYDGSRHRRVGWPKTAAEIEQLTDRDGGWPCRRSRKHGLPLRRRDLARRRASVRPSSLDDCPNTRRQRIPARCCSRSFSFHSASASRCLRYDLGSRFHA